MSYSVLVVDDSSVVRSMVAKALGMAGLDVKEVHQASNGREALQVLGDRWIDVVFADIHMPEMSGLELVQAMAEKELLASIPVVIVSSQRSQEQVDELLARGVRAYVQKPFRPEDLRKVVAEVLRPAGGKEASGGR